MKKWNKRKFINLVQECALTIGIENLENVKTIILYQILNYSLQSSNLLIKNDEVLNLKTGFLPDRKTYFSFGVENVDNYFQPEIYDLVLKYISKHIPEMPIYLLAGFVHEKLLEIHIAFIDGMIEIFWDNTLKRNTGAFFTPFKTAEDFIDNIFMNLMDNSSIVINNYQVLDLACGCGIFSLHVLKNLTLRMADISNIQISQEMLNSMGIPFGVNLKTSTKILLHTLFNQLHAVDQDVISLEITRYSLLLFALKEEKNIYSLETFFQACKSLRKNIRQFDLMNYYQNNISMENMVQYDLVVSNPPYLSFYSRHSKNSSDCDFSNMKINLSYAGNKKRGRLNSIMFFMDFAIKATKPSGLLAFLVDMNIHERLYLEMRSSMLENLTILETGINIFNFPGVNSGQSFIYLQNKKSRKDHQVKIVNHESYRQTYILQESLRYDASFYKNDQSDILDYLSSFPKLGDCCKISSGVNMGGISGQFLSSEKKDDNHYIMVNPAMLKNPYDLPVFDNPFYIDFNNEKAKNYNILFKEGGKKNVIALGNRDRFILPKIFIRQSAARIIATYIEMEAACPYSMFVVNQTTTYNLFVLLAILNSDLISYYSNERGIIRVGRGKQPQIRKFALQTIPVPEEKMIQDWKEPVEEYVRRILKLSAEKRGNFQSDMIRIKEKLEQIVCSMYRLNYDDLKAKKKLEYGYAFTSR